MKVIHVLGIGCERCSQVKANVQAAVDSLGIDCDVLEVHDIDEIVEFGALMTPALAIDGEVVIEGKIAEVDEIVRLLK